MVLKDHECAFNLRVNTDPYVIVGRGTPGICPVKNPTLPYSERVPETIGMIDRPTFSRCDLLYLTLTPKAILLTVLLCPSLLVELLSSFFSFLRSCLQGRLLPSNPTHHPMAVHWTQNRAPASSYTNTTSILGLPTWRVCTLACPCPQVCWHTLWRVSVTQ